MTNTKSTKGALLTSSISILLCVAMLLGTTFAWFTDSATSSGNIIKAGNLDVTLHYADGTKAVPAVDSTEWKDASTEAIFNYENWEPGYVDVKHIKIANVGSLALKYQVAIVSNGKVSKLSDVIDVYYADPAVRVAERTDLTDSNKIGTLTEVLANMPNTAYGELKEGEFHTITLALKMQESAGNDYKNLSIGSDFKVVVSATQLDAELDSFGDGYDKDALIKGKKITSGTFSINPAEYDETLAEPDSEYIAIEFEKDGKTQWIVEDRATTVVLAPDKQSAQTLKNYTVTPASGKLYSIISSLQNNEHTTVYLLPGTYNEATTIYVYSNMDIIGLGDKDAVKVVKQSSSNSNRHLFNVSGTKKDYIHVTLQNMYLDSVAKTTGNKSNAAVQSIRKSKVKCFELTINNGSGWEDAAFYVNGNNAVDGVKYTAYMYVENCTVKTNRVVSTSGTYKFYHHNLKYNGGADYTGSTKKQMSANSWEW